MAKATKKHTPERAMGLAAKEGALSVQAKSADVVSSGGRR